ncbi:unnamed protein product, partial [Peniophora sp. CBMAI 1063]
MDALDATQLSRWTRFAAKGGIGRATALVDYVAEQAQDLMFLKGDEIVVLMKLEEGGDVYLGHCEGVIGRFSASNVRFHSKLKTPVRTRRSSLAKSTASNSTSRPLSSTSTYASGSGSLSRPASRDEIRAVSVTSPVPLATYAAAGGVIGGSPGREEFGGVGASTSESGQSIAASGSAPTLSTSASDNGSLSLGPSSTPTPTSTSAAIYTTSHNPTPSLSFSSSSSTPYSPRTPIDAARVFGHERGAFGYEKGAVYGHGKRPSEASGYSHASSASASYSVHAPPPFPVHSNAAGSPAASARTFGHKPTASSVYSVREVDESRSVYSQDMDDGGSVYSQRSGRIGADGDGDGEGGERTSLVRTASLSTLDGESLRARDSILRRRNGEGEGEGERTSLVRTASLSSADRASLVRRSISMSMSSFDRASGHRREEEDSNVEVQGEGEG